MSAEGHGKLFHVFRAGCLDRLTWPRVELRMSDMEQRSVPSRIGTLLVGAGFIADVHAAAVTSSDRAHLAGVVDSDRARAAAFARSHGAIPYTDDLAEALAWPEVDAVVVCTPNHTHRRIGTAIAAAGKHLLIEKPLATRSEERRVGKE